MVLHSAHQFDGAADEDIRHEAPVQERWLRIVCRQHFPGVQHQRHVVARVEGTCEDSDKMLPNLKIWRYIFLSALLYYQPQKNGPGHPLSWSPLHMFDIDRMMTVQHVPVRVQFVSISEMFEFTHPYVPDPSTSSLVNNISARSGLYTSHFHSAKRGV